MIIQVLVAYKVYNYNTIVHKVTCVLIPFLSFLCLIHFGIDVIQKSSYYSDYNKTEWLEKEEKPIKMIRTIKESKMLIGMSKEELIETLGPSQESYRRDSNQFYFDTDRYESPLLINLKKDTVVDIYMSCYD